MQKALVNPEMTRELKTYRPLGAAVELAMKATQRAWEALQSSSHFQSQRESSWFQLLLLSQPHTLGCLLCAARHQQRMGAPGAAHKGLQLDKSHSALGRCGSGEGTFVKTQQFVNTRSEVLMEKSVCVQMAAVHPEGGGGCCWQRGFLTSRWCSI